MKNDLNKSTKYTAYFIVPIYNVDVDEALLNKNFAGYKILRNTTIVEQYSNLHNLYALYEDIKPIHAGMLYTRPLANYVLIKKIKLYRLYTKENNAKNNDIINQESLRLVHLIVAMRLHKNGNIQISRVYIMSERDFHGFNVKISTPIQFADNFYEFNNDFCRLENYQITPSDNNKILSIRNMLQKCDDSLFLPIGYFMAYYSSGDLTDKLIKLCTIWEATVLNDCKNELQYKLIVRGCALLNKDYSQIFKVAYDIRSQLLHTGKAELKKLKKLLDKQYEQEASFIFTFIKDNLEPITRDILIKFIKNHIKTKRDLCELAKEIDILIFKKLTS